MILLELDSNLCRGGLLLSGCILCHINMSGFDIA